MATSLSIVLIEDHDALRWITADILRQAGHQVLALACAEDLDDQANAAPVDLFILDLNLPGEDGISLAQRLRASHGQVGIIMVTARSDAQASVVGYESGADIYLVKPVAPGELLAAMNALARRLKPALTAGTGIRLESGALQLCGPLGRVPVIATEAALLTALARAPSQRIDLRQVAAALGQTSSGPNKASIEVRIARLRKKLIEIGAPADQTIRAIRLQGYQLCVPITVV